MKPEFIFVLIALGTFVCATYAFPTSSEIQQESNDDHTSLREELNAIVANSQDRAFVNIQRGLGSLFMRGLKGAGNFIKNHRRGITKGLGRFTGGLLGTLGGGDTGTSYPGGAAPRYRYPHKVRRYPGKPGAAPRYRYPNKAPRYQGYPGDSLDSYQSQPDGDETDQSSEEEEMVNL